MGVTRVRQAAAELEGALGALELDGVPVPAAGDLVEVLARLERMVAAARVRLAHRVAAVGAHRRSGDRDAPAYLARLSGSPRARARRELELAGRLEALPALEAAFAQGTLSVDQAEVVARAATRDPAVADELVRAAGGRSFQELRELARRAERCRRTEEDERARERRVHARRYCRTWVPDEGGVRLDAWVTAADGARLLAALTKKTDELLDRCDDPAERLRADALVELCAGEGVATQMVLRVDAGALVRGGLDQGELCEIDGVGPVSLAVARSLLGEAFCTLLVTDGVDVATVTSTSRVVPHRVRMALLQRDPTCVVPGCGATFHLEIDHWRTDFARGGMTELDNLCRLCSVHHKMKTQGGFRLLGGPGRWRFVPP